MIDRDIILELSEVLTQLTYSIHNDDKYFRLFISLKNLYDAIGFYTYGNLDLSEIWYYSIIPAQKLEDLDSYDDEHLKYLVNKVILKIQQLENIRKLKDLKDRIISDRFLSGFVERDSMEQTVKRLTWRFGCCLAINLRAGGDQGDSLLQFMFEFLDFLNEAIYSSPELSILEEILPPFEARFRTISYKTKRYPHNIIKKEFEYTAKELKKLYTPLMEAKINDYITLKLVSGKTDIYIKGKLFNQCKYLLFTLPIDELENYEEIDSIDEIADILKWTINGQQEENGELISYEISPEVEFWGHCSNLQAWAENNYDTRILHSSLSFPLLRKLTEVDDPIATAVFQEEIYKRFLTSNPSTLQYLLEEKYLRYLTEEQREDLLYEWMKKDIENVVVFLIGNNYLDQFGERYRSTIVGDLSTHIETSEKAWLEEELRLLFEELEIYSSKGFVTQLISKDRAILKEIFDLRQYPVPKEAVGGINYTHLGVLKELKDFLVQLSENDDVLKEIIIQQVQSLFETHSVGNMFSLLMYSFYEFIPLDKFKEMMKMEKSPFLDNIFGYLGHEVLMMYFDSSLVPYNFLFTYFDDECRKIFGSKVRALPLELNKRVIFEISKRKGHKTYHGDVVKLLQIINYNDQDNMK